MDIATAAYNANAGAGVLARPERTPAVASQLDDLQRTVSRVENAASTLCDRLSPVQRQSVPQPGTDQKNSVREALCPLADQLRNVTDSLNTIQRLLESNRERLEI